MYQSNFNALIEQLNDMDIRKQFFIKTNTVLSERCSIQISCIQHIFIIYL